MNKTILPFFHHFNADGFLVVDDSLLTYHFSMKKFPPQKYLSLQRLLFDSSPVQAMLLNNQKASKIAKNVPKYSQMLSLLKIGSINAVRNRIIEATYSLNSYQ